MKNIKTFENFNISESMAYPSMEEVESASHYQICGWWRFLDSPGTSSIGTDNFEDVLDKEVKIMNRIKERLGEFGGFTPKISKSLGWGENG